MHRDEGEPIDWVEFDDGFDNDINEERAGDIVQKYKFDFDRISKLQSNDADGQRKDIIRYFVEYYKGYLEE